MTELEPAAGYSIKDPATQDCYIKAGTQKTLTFENTPLSAIVIKKVDADTGAPLEGAWFRIRFLGGTAALAALSSLSVRPAPMAPSCLPE